MCMCVYSLFLPFYDDDVVVYARYNQSLPNNCNGNTILYYDIRNSNELCVPVRYLFYGIFGDTPLHRWFLGFGFDVSFTTTALLPCSCNANKPISQNSKATTEQQSWGYGPQRSSRCCVLRSIVAPKTSPEKICASNTIQSNTIQSIMLYCTILYYEIS